MHHSEIVAKTSRDDLHVVSPVTSCSVLLLPNNSITLQGGGILLDNSTTLQGGGVSILLPDNSIIPQGGGISILLPDNCCLITQPPCRAEGSILLPDNSVTPQSPLGSRLLTDNSVTLQQRWAIPTSILLPDCPAGQRGLHIAWQLHHPTGWRNLHTSAWFVGPHETLKPKPWHSVKDTQWKRKKQFLHWPNSSIWVQCSDFGYCWCRHVGPDINITWQYSGSATWSVSKYCQVCLVMCPEHTRDKENSIYGVLLRTHDIQYCGVPCPPCLSNFVLVCPMC